MMVATLEEEGQVNPQPRVRVDLTEAITVITIADFMSSTSRRISSEGLGIKMDFLNIDLSEGSSYRSSRQVLCGIAAVNDFADRRVTLIQDYNQLLTKYEQPGQYVLQVVEWHRIQTSETGSL